MTTSILVFARTDHHFGAPIGARDIKRNGSFARSIIPLFGRRKTDSAPVRGDGYEPGSSKFRLRANAETSYSSAIGPGGGSCERYGR